MSVDEAMRALSKLDGTILGANENYPNDECQMENVAHMKRAILEAVRRGGLAQGRVDELAEQLKRNHDVVVTKVLP